MGFFTAEALNICSETGEMRVKFNTIYKKIMDSKYFRWQELLFNTMCSSIKIVFCNIVNFYIFLSCGQNN